MKIVSIFIGLITLFITLPLSFYQNYLLYQHVHADGLMWFLFWFNMPILILASTLSTITSKFLVEKAK